MPRLLLVTSADFGELANALYFLDGLAADAHLLLPPRLLALNPALPRPASAYRSLADIRAAIAAHRPDVLLLFSAYLFAINNLLSPADVAALLGTPIPLATTDPFLGLLTRPITDDTFARGHPARAALIAHFRALADNLRPVPHLYISDPAGLTDSPALAFFNPRLVPTFAERAAFPNVLAAGGLPTDRPHWLFILSSEDYAAQAAARGPARVDAHLGALLARAAPAGRRAVLLAPEPVCAGVRPHTDPGVTCVPFCDHATFRAALLSAEYAFYFNTLSNSILARVAAGGPVFFLSAGHLKRALPGVVPLARRSYYAGAAVPVLDPRDLEPAALAARAAAQPALFAPALAAFRALPSPDAALAALLSRKAAS